jgi:hypothetical protein
MNCEKLNSGILTGITSGLGIFLLSQATKEFGIEASLAASAASFILSMVNPAALQHRVSRSETENSSLRKILSTASQVFHGPIRVLSMDPQTVWFGIGRGLLCSAMLKFIAGNSIDTIWFTPIFALATTYDVISDDRRVPSDYLPAMDSPV